MSPSSPSLPPPALSPSSSQLHQGQLHQEHDTTPSLPPQHHKQQHQHTSSLSPRSPRSPPPRLAREDSPPATHPLDHNHNHAHNYNYNYTKEDRSYSTYRDTYNYEERESSSVIPTEHDRRDRSAAVHTPHYHPDSNLSGANSPRQQSSPPPAYYRWDAALLPRRSVSPAGGAAAVETGPLSDVSSRRYYPSSSSEHCRESCCVDASRAPYHGHSSSFPYAVYSRSSVSSQAHSYPSESSRGAPYSPDSPRTPAFSPSLHSSSSSSPSSSTSSFTPTPSPATMHNPHQRVIFHDSPRKRVSSASKRVNNNDERMDLDHQEETIEYPKSAKTTTSKTAAKPFKIPRPANSFMLYRAENGKKYPGLVATELSAKLGEAWRREPQDVRDRYDEMAEQAKRDHALKYPDYKFAPVKRGTGKRALKLAAEAIANEMAEMDAAALLISLSSMTPATGIDPTSSGSRDSHQRQYVPIGRARPTSVAATSIRPKAQRPFKVASLNNSNVPISNDANVSSSSSTNASLSDKNSSGSNSNNSQTEQTSSNDRTEALVKDTNAASQQQQQQQQSSRAYPQLSPPLILFREALARRSPQLASSLVAQIVINVWFGVTEELRERYEILAESDPRFKDKSNYVNHSQISGTPTTASEAMMANQIAQLLKKAAAGEQLVLPHSNKRKGSANTASGHLPAAKLAKLAPASFNLPTERAPVSALVSAPPQDVPAPVSSSSLSPSPSSLSPPTSQAILGAPAKIAPDSVPDQITTVPSRNDLAPVVVVPMPMASPNKRQTRASVTMISMSGYSPSTSVTPSSRSSLVASSSTARSSTAKKAVTPIVSKERLDEKIQEKVTAANRPVRRVTRPPRYSA